MSDWERAGDIIDASLRSGDNVIFEDDAKEILKEFNVDVVAEKRAFSVAETARRASETGFPVVLKGLSSASWHKTEQGLVKVGLMSPYEVENAALEIEKTAGKDLKRFLVQPMIKGRREFVAGMFRDPDFGPVIMFGLGGIFTEALADVVFRMAPLRESDIAEMQNELMSTKLLRGYRGEKPVDREAIKRVLFAVSELSVTFPEIKEIDINPLIAGRDGRVTAVDALIVTGEAESSPRTDYHIDKETLRSCFYPKSIVFVGASGTLGKWGHFLVTNTLGGGYKGEVYLVNPKGGVIAGRPVYRSISDIEKRVDLAVVTIPAGSVQGILPELEAKGVKGMLLITSGFSETGEAGALLEKRLAEESYKRGILILGPNTMGICNPHINLFCTGTKVQPMPGSTSLVCQSGNLGTQLLVFAEQQDIGIRAYSGSGNEAMVTVEDYMEAFETDELTRTVVLYIESIKQGRRFFQSAARVSRKKPVIVLKGGRTGAGAKAAASHTGAMATDANVFSQVLKQAGVIEVEQSMDLLDLSAVFSSLPLPAGNRVAIMTLGGGWGVVTTDLCSENGLEVPTLSDRIVSRLDTLLPDFWSRGNPVDIVGERDPEIPITASEELLKWDGCDAVIHLGIHGQRLLGKRMLDSAGVADPAYPPGEMSSVRNILSDIERRYIDHIASITCKYEKPLVGVSILVDENARTLYRVEGCKYKAVFFPSPERAVKALAGMYRYKRFLDIQRSDF